MTFNHKIILKIKDWLLIVIFEIDKVYKIQIMDIKLLSNFKEVDKGIWELSRGFRAGMRVPLRIVATREILEALDDGAVEQGINVSKLPGIVNASFMMPDAHWGYGFPIGGVAAFDMKDGVISPGGIGFDINCGMRLIATNLSYKEVFPKIKDIVDELFEFVPAGLGGESKLNLTKKDFLEILRRGAEWAVELGLGEPEDLNKIEDNGCLKEAETEFVSKKAIERGINQIGTLGSGNHYLEVQRVENIFDKNLAERMSIFQKDQIVIMVHCGSRGFGHQIATDYINLFGARMKKYGISVDDKQLACVPVDSEDGRRYFSAMNCAANSAFCNRQIITHQIRQVFSRIFSKSSKDLGMNLVYDVAHNIAKVEEHQIEGKGLKNKMMIHRKGATRSFINQPVIIGGSMETGSYLLVGTENAMRKTFASTAHGSGRVMSRIRAKKEIRGSDLQKKLQEKGIYIKTASYSGLAEEAGFAYKNIDDVVMALSNANISQPVASFKPIGNIKG